jgi:hypothetical protein
MGRATATNRARAAFLRRASARLDRYAGRNANFVLVASDRIAVPAARSASGNTGNRPRLCRDIKGRALGWFNPAPVWSPKWGCSGFPSVAEPVEERWADRFVRGDLAIRRNDGK